jgi:hypothetical protein
MFKMLVAIGPCKTRSRTGIASTPNSLTTREPGSTFWLTVASVAPRRPSHTTGRNWPNTLAKNTFFFGIEVGRKRE